MHERHADPLDEATALASSVTDAAIEEVRRANAPETHPDFDGETCVDCGEDIPAGRLALGKIRCINCQRILEQRQRQSKQFGRPQTGFSWPESDT